MKADDFGPSVFEQPCSMSRHFIGRTRGYWFVPWH